MRVGDKVWYCKRLKEEADDGERFEAPVEIKTALGYFTVMPKSGYYDILEFGEKITQYLTVIAQPYAKWFGVFEIGDLFYCDGKEPTADEEFYGEKANYTVDSVENGNMLVKLTLKRVVS